MLISREEMVDILASTDEARLEALRMVADDTRRNAVGDEVHIRCIVEISNNCRRDCAYCGLRNGNERLARYRMPLDEIIRAAEEAAAAGWKTIVIQAGEDPMLKAKRVARLVEEIKDRCDVAVTLSLGEYSLEDFKMFKEAGADRYLLRHETSDPELYHRLHAHMRHENRVRCLGWLKEAGFQTGAGMMIGLPGQSVESIADDILFMKKMDVDKAGIGPFIPHADTPLAGEPAGALGLTLKAIALARVTMPHLMIPATTAIGTIDSRGRAEALRWGANVLMINATPHEYRDLYETYPGRAYTNGGGVFPGKGVEELVLSLGRRVGAGYGHCTRSAAA